MRNRRLKMGLLQLLIFQLLLLLTNSHSCASVASWNWIPGWTYCYQSQYGHVIGNSQGSLSSCHWQCTTWDYDFNNAIAFMTGSTLTRQYWNYNYHSSSFCCGWGCCSTSWGSGWYCVSGYYWSDYYGCAGYDFQYNYWADSSNDPVTLLPCHPYCSSCYNSWTHTSCTGCWNRNGNAYRWLAWNSPTTYIDTCHSYCPNDADRGYDNAAAGQYFQTTGSTLCSMCNTSCSTCADGWGGQRCSYCVSSAALIMNYDLCRSTFTATDNVHCQADYQCAPSNCPTNLYFWLNKTQTTQSPYTWTNGNVALQRSHICYLCHSYCLKCSNLYYTTCTQCAINAYRSLQWGSASTYVNTCDIRCYNDGDRGYDNLHPGQYIATTGSRVCQQCNTTCSTCADGWGGQRCSYCVSTAALIMNYDLCRSTFTATDNVHCQADYQCAPSNCPTNLYFWLNKTQTTQATYSWTFGTITLQRSHICYLCHSYCLKCYNLYYTTCTQCAINAYRSLQWGSASTYVNTCDIRCYNDGDRSYDNLYPGQYIAVTGSRVCQRCNTTCSTCADLYNGQRCSYCVTTAALIMNNNLCMSTYTAADNYLCQADYQCVANSCPTNLYFWLNRSQTTGSAYLFTNGNIALQRSHFCYLCHKYCLRCTDQYDHKCTHCSASYYLWQQYTTRCNYYCIEGSYTASGLKGQYVISTSTRTCGTCDTGCQFCAGAANQCYKCQDNYYLLDDRAKCASTYTCTLCTNTSYVTDGCATADTYCRPSNCPIFFYFEVNRTGSGSIDGSTNVKYLFFTEDATLDLRRNGYELGTGRASNSTWTSPQGANTSYFYRKDTNFCKLCDFRCMRCFGPTNSQCTHCINGYFKWTNDFVCSINCPQGQFKMNLVGTYPDTQTKCANCHAYCIACIGYELNCSSCKQYPSTNYSFLFSYAPGNSTCLRTCFTSGNTLTQKGYYGSINNMVCYPCPGQCSDCNINTVMDLTNNPELRPIVCDNDNRCTKGIVCTACLAGFTLVSGQCIDQNTCKQYSFYDQGSSSSSWSPTNCKCLKGFYISEPITCAPCHMTCLTCSGGLSSNCLTCYDGYILTSGTCSSTATDNLVLQNSLWTSSTAFNSYVSTNSPTNKYTCGSYTTLFGYKSPFSTGSTFTYTTNTISTANYYAISFKLKVLFIDYWDKNGGLYFYLGSDANPYFIYNYDNYGVLGQQQCGTNINDYMMIIDGSIPLTPSNGQSYTVTVKANMNPIQNSTGFYYYFGIQSALFTVLQCHADCKTCTGPAANQCTSCSSTQKTISGGSCICNAASNYFYVVGSTTTCQIGCPNCNSSTNANACYYRDFATATCVNPPTVNCTAPNLYGNFYDLVNTYGTCVQNCSGGLYIAFSLMKCVASCSVYSQYNYKGANTTSGVFMWTCVSTCPNGLIADPSTSDCVNICPSGYYWKMQNRTINSICVNNCTTGYEYDNTRQCVASCPAGFYTQTLSGHNKCVSTCQNGMFGDNVTLSCVNFCPTPSIADPTMSLCVNACPAGYAFQIKVSDGSRVCVTTCESGQWMNIYFMNCSKNPMDCPSGTFADNSTLKCQQRCKRANEVGQNSTRMCRTSCLTGYAYWDVGLCVTNCNNTMFGRIYNGARQCVFACDTNVTGLFGDIQASRTCMKTCSSLPKATFGDNITGLCVEKCTYSYHYGDAYHPNRYCVTLCSNFPTQTFSFYLTRQCLLVCPQGFYGDNYTTLGIGICSTKCPTNYYGDPTTNLCVLRCPFRYYGVPVDPRPCVDTCPFGYYSTNLTSNRVCTSVCDTGLWADNYTRACVNQKKLCSNYTFADSQKKLCVTGSNCTAGTYADPFTMGCESVCSNSTYFGDPSTNLCVTLCPTTPDYYSQSGKCTPSCTGWYFADWQANRTCLIKCSSNPIPLYGTSAFRCVKASECGIGLYGNNNTQNCSACSGTLPFGDPIIFQCVRNCSITYYGDYNTALCTQTCNLAIGEYADNFTGTCTKLCTNTTYGVNLTTGPRCDYSCPPNSYALQSTRICVGNCGTGFFGDPITGRCFNSSLNCSSGYFGNTVTNMCVLPQSCQTVGTLHYYADNTTKMCIPKCTSPNYGLNTTWYCIAKCTNPYFAENTTRMCLVTTGCGEFLSFADSQLNICVTRCSTAPVFTFSQNITYTCVIPKSCPSSMYAENLTQSCVYYCPYNSTYLSYSDSFKTNRCVAKCPDLYFGDNSTGYGQCLSVCTGLNFFRDNTTQICVFTCPKANTTLGSVDTYGDNTTDMCVSKCPFGYFAQAQVNRTCVRRCMDGTWGNQVTRMCINKPVTDCPAGTWADNFTNLCTGTCSSNSSNSQIFYGENITKLCIPSCPVPTFAYIPTRVCIDICPVTTDNSPGTFGDPSTTPTRLCVSVCLTTGLYRDVANNRTCQPTCTFNSSYKTYKDPTSMTCVAECPTYPQYLYAWGTNNTNAECVSSCPTGFMNQANMSCVSKCPYLLDPTSNKCVAQCPYNSASNTILYADLTSFKCVSADLCPNNTYASDDLLTCLSSCPNDTYIYLKNCVSMCPDGLYIDTASRSCVGAKSCPNNTFGNNQTRTCSSTCTNGTFADATTKTCITQCYGTNYADSMTKACTSNCSSGLVKNDITLSCVGSCSPGFFFNPLSSNCSTTCQSPYFADSTTSACVLTCSSNPITFSSTSPTRACVTTCPTTASWFDLINRACTASCTTGTYQYSVNSSCVSFCPKPYYRLTVSCVLNCSSGSLFADQLTRTCVSACPQGYFKDPTTAKCVSSCSITPIRYYAVTVSSVRNCVTNCPSNTYADNEVGSCVTKCSVSPVTYAQPNTWKCVASCPAAYSQFADPTTQKCVTKCPSGYFADNRQRLCLKNCSNIYFADSLTNPPACVSVCTSGTFADPVLFQCVTKCSNTYYSYTPNNTCLQFCPYGYFADYVSGYCVEQCRNSPILFADSLTRLCSSSCSENQFSFIALNANFGTCVNFCPNTYFSNPITKTCVTKCPNQYFGSTVNNTCNNYCDQKLFKDSINNLCQSTCPLANSLFGQPFSRTCVLNCSINTNVLLFADPNSRRCVAVCSGGLFGNPLTKTCVDINSCTGGLFADSKYSLCVDRCYDQTYSYSGRCWGICPDSLFADQDTRKCVNATTCSFGLYADPTKGKCVKYCDINSTRYAEDSSRTCQLNCTSPLYADNITRTCATKCTSIPQYYGHNTTRLCVQYCPAFTFGDPVLNLCVLKCSDGYYGDNSTWTCVTKCSFGNFGDNTTNMCVSTCPASAKYFGDKLTSLCVKTCGSGLYADQFNNRMCESTCLSPLFSQNSTNQCRTGCLTGFSDPTSRQCIGVCPTGYYGHSYICHPNQCPEATVVVFADDSTNLCVTECPNGTYAQISSKKCVSICPIQNSQFADTTNKVCVSTCSGTYADFSTRTCVSTCPTVPALFAQGKLCVFNCTGGLFADNSTRTCQYNCPNSTYADNSTWTCVSMCPTKPLMYGQNITNTCVFTCSDSYDRFADNSSRTCVKNCPNGTFADPVSRSCVNTCPLGYFATNSSKRCEKVCAYPQLADSLIRTCVAQCSINPIFYGDQINHVCVPKCPTNSFGNPLTQQCVYNIASNSDCPDGYFADSTTQLCVQVCPMKSNLYANPLNKKCETSCPTNYYLDNSTMRCVQICPVYPSYFSDGKKCVKYCASGTYADNLTRVCVTTCPNNTFSDNSTWRCVSSCPSNLKTFRDTTTWKCVSICPTNYLADYFTLRCVLTCPPQGNGFAKNDTKQCVKICPSGSYAYLLTRTCIAKCYNGTYADNTSRSCLTSCPRSPALYAHPIKMQCVSICDQGMFSFDDTRQCVFDCPALGYYRQNSSRSCVQSCNITEDTYTDNLTGYCVERCSVNTYADPTTMRCNSMCPDQPLLYAENSTQSCLKVCPGSLFGQNVTRTCVVACPSGSLSLPSSNLCVFNCPINFYAYQPTQFCMDKCPQPYYGDPSTRKCVLQCPINQLLFSDNSSQTCVAQCPKGSYAYQWSISCLSSCPIAVAPFVQTYAADYDNTCTVQCDYPFYSYDEGFKCVNSCPDPYYNRLQNHKCQLCPTTCSSCVGTSSCRTCKSNFFLQDGKCVADCSSLYYANPNTRICGSSLLCRPFFGVNSTRKCQSSCASGQFANSRAFRCDACPDTCITCTSSTNCLNCISTSLFANNYCYGFCNTIDPTFMYFQTDNITCTDSCSIGTYSFIVFCKKCDDVCSSCTISAKNCTSCARGLYLNVNACATSCPQTFKPNFQRVCVSCGDSCGEGLTYNTNVTNVNGQTSVFMNFNNEVNIYGNIYQTISVDSKSRRLLQTGTNLGYQIIVIDAQTIQIVFPPGTSNTDFNIQITNPQNIVDGSGNLPSSLQTSVAFDASQMYSSSISNSPNDFPLYFTFLGIICVISLIFDIELMKFLQLLYIHYFVTFNLPPVFLKVFNGLRYSTLFYLPNLYSVTDAVIRPSVPSSVYNTIGDYNFLRNAGFSFTPLVVLLVIMGILKLLSVEEINRFKRSRIWCRTLLEEKFKYAVLLEWMHIFALNTIFFAFLQLRDYNIYDQFTEVSLIIAHCIIVVFVIAIVLISYKILSFKKQYPKLSKSIKKAADIILKDDQADQASSSNVFNAQKKKIDMRDMQYPKLNNQNIFPFKCIYRYNTLSLFCPNAQYLRGILISIFITFFQSSSMQMGAAIALNILMLMYFSKARPYTFKFNGLRIRNYFAIYHQACLIIFEILMLILGIKNDNGATPTEKEEFSYFIIYYLAAVCSITFIYHLITVITVLYRKFWLAFIETELFRTNFPEKYAQYQKQKNKGQKLLRTIDPKAKQALKNLIKGYKSSTSILRPTKQQKKSSIQLPLKYKVTMLDRSQSSSSASKTTLSKAQKKQMLKEIFNNKQDVYMEQKKKVMKQAEEFEEINNDSQITELQYEEYQEEIEIKAKDLEKYVANGKELLRLKQAQGME